MQPARTWVAPRAWRTLGDRPVATSQQIRTWKSMRRSQLEGLQRGDMRPGSCQFVLGLHVVILYVAVMAVQGYHVMSDWFAA